MIYSKTIHDRLLKSSNSYQLDWNGIYSHRSEEILYRWSKIDSKISNLPSDIDSVLKKLDDQSRRFFVRVAERPFQRSRIRKDLAYVANNVETLNSAYLRRLADLEKFTKTIHDCVSLYGGIKNINALQETFIRRGKRDSLLVDCNDLVRFRVVCDTAIAIQRVCFEFYDRFFDEIILCKNYYLNPVGPLHFRPYRGVHFVIVDESGIPAEIQIITINRDVVGILDHKTIYKSVDEIATKDEIEYIRTMSFVANMLDLFSH